MPVSSGNERPLTDKYASLNRNFQKRTVADIMMHSCEAGEKNRKDRTEMQIEHFRASPKDRLQEQQDLSAESFVDNSGVAQYPEKVKALDVNADFVDSGITVSGTALSPYKRPLGYKTMKTIYPQKLSDLKVLHQSGDVSNYNSTVKNNTADKSTKPETPIREKINQEVNRKSFQTVTNYELHI